MTFDRVAIIDLGSNTFHLLICEIHEDGTWEVIHKERIYVRLASGGLDQIQSESIERGVLAMKGFAEQIFSFGVKEVRCIGTAALREAQNGQAIADKIKNETGLFIEIIDGQKEAGYIFRGIKSCLPPLDRPGLIMDIGGGSVEFILFNGDTILFKGSYKIGVAVLYRAFHHSDPISPQEIEQLEALLAMELAPLIAIVREHPDFYLIGASGSFEVIRDVLPVLQKSISWAEMDQRGVLEYLNEVIQTDIKSRRQIPEIPIERLDYIVVAYLLIRFVYEHIPPKRLFFCDFALKEGVLMEIIEKLNLD